MPSASPNALTDEERQSIQSESLVILADNMSNKKKSKSSSRSLRKMQRNNCDLDLDSINLTRKLLQAVVIPNKQVMLSQNWLINEVVTATRGPEGPERLT